MKIFLDASDIDQIRKYKDRVDGFTTNPTLMRRVGVTDYEKWAKEVLEEVGDKPVSFEVIADDFDEMERQAKKISNLGKSVYVKIPITNSSGELTAPIISGLLIAGVKLNITAITTPIENTPNFALPPPTDVILSVFSGRIADTGINPIEIIKKWKSLLPPYAELLWASPREVLNIYQAEEAGADIITCTPELLEKYWKFKGMDLNELSLMTVKQFYNDAVESGLKL